MARRKRQLKPIRIDPPSSKSGPDFSTANREVTLERSWDPEKRRFTRTVTFHPLVLDEFSTVRIYTPPEDLRCRRRCDRCRLKPICSRYDSMPEVH